MSSRRTGWTMLAHRDVGVVQPAAAEALEVVVVGVAGVGVGVHHGAVGPVVVGVGGDVAPGVPTTPFRNAMSAASSPLKS